MPRDSIYVGDREIVERFVGGISVWRKYRLLRSLPTTEVSTEFNERQNEAYFYNYRGGFDSFSVGDSTVVKIKRGGRETGYIDLRNLYFYGNVKLTMKFKNSADFYEMKNLLENDIAYVGIDFYRKG